MSPKRDIDFQHCSIGINKGFLLPVRDTANFNIVEELKWSPGEAKISCPVHMKISRHEVIELTGMCWSKHFHGAEVLKMIQH